MKQGGTARLTSDEQCDYGCPYHLGKPRVPRLVHGIKIDYMKKMLRVDYIFHFIYKLPKKDLVHLVGV